MKSFLESVGLFAAVAIWHGRNVRTSRLNHLFSFSFSGFNRVRRAVLRFLEIHSVRRIRRTVQQQQQQFSQFSPPIAATLQRQPPALVGQSAAAVHAPPSAAATATVRRWSSSIAAIGCQTGTARLERVQSASHLFGFRIQLGVPGLFDATLSVDVERIVGQAESQFGEKCLVFGQFGQLRLQAQRQERRQRYGRLPPAPREEQHRSAEVARESQAEVARNGREGQVAGARQRASAETRRTADRRAQLPPHSLLQCRSCAGEHSA
jgi:hypothetical protein